MSDRQEIEDALNEKDARIAELEKAIAELPPYLSDPDDSHFSPEVRELRILANCRL